MFSLFGYDWQIDGPWGAPGGGTFQPSNVFVLPNALVLQLTQTPSGASVDAEVISAQKFGYGTFEFRAAVDPVESGQVASGFLFYDNSETEIDVELTGNLPQTVWFTNYSGLANKQYSEIPGHAQAAFHTYKFVWQPGKIAFYIDGVLVTTHTEHVPSAPAFFLFNFWGTNSSAWGGTATPGTRHLFITHFRYTPL